MAQRLASVNIPFQDFSLAGLEQLLAALEAERDLVGLAEGARGGAVGGREAGQGHEGAPRRGAWPRVVVLDEHGGPVQAILREGIDASR